MHAVADFCLIPMGIEEVGVTKYIAECQRVLEKSGLEYKLHGCKSAGARSSVRCACMDSAGLTPILSVLDPPRLPADGTGVQGEFSQVMKVIEECHQAVHAMGCPRVATDIRIGTRTDKQGSLDNKVSSVQQLLSKDEPQKE